MKSLGKASLATMAMAASLTVCISGCASGSGGGNTSTGSSNNKPVNGGTLTLGETTKWEDMWVPLMNDASPTFAMWGLSFDSLMTWDNNLSVKPQIAQSWKYTDSTHKTLDVKLNPKAHWSDGKPITSDDVLLFLNFIGSKAYQDQFQGEYGYLVSPLKGSDQVLKGTVKSFADTGGFKKISDQEFQVTVSKPDPAFIANYVANWIPFPSHVWGKTPFDQWQDASFDKKPTVVSGPYVPTQVNGQSNVEYKANENYYKGKPHISKIVLKYVSENVLPTLLENGQIDMNIEGNNLDFDSFVKMKQDPNLGTHAQPALSYGYVGLRMDKPKFQNVKLRQAMEYAINREAICQGVYKGLAKPAYGPLLPNTWASATPQEGMNTYKYDPKKAEQLLDEAGFKLPKGQKWRIDPETGQAETYHLVFSSGSPQVQAICDEVASDLQKVGLHVVTDTPLDFNTMLKRMSTKDPKLDMFFLANSLTVDPDPRGVWMSNDAQNFDQWKDPHNDALIEKTFSEKAFNKNYRRQAFVNWQLYVNQQLPMLFIYNRDDIWAYNKRVHIPQSDWLIGATPSGQTDIQDWWISQ